MFLLMEDIPQKILSLLLFLLTPHKNGPLLLQAVLGDGIHTFFQGLPALSRQLRSDTAVLGWTGLGNNVLAAWE